jgi:hypothetical protein
LSIKILVLGEIVGKAGVYCIKSHLKALKKEYAAEFVIANGDGVTGGFGLGKNHSIYLRKLGINVITLGDCAYYKKDMVDHIQHSSYILRPVNYPQGNPGRGWRYYTVGEKNIAVISVLGQSGFPRHHLSNPFSQLPGLIDHIKSQTATILIDFHALTTAEKWSLFYHLDGSVSAVMGTGTKILTPDAQVLERGTSVITDLGRTGSSGGIGGFDPAVELGKFLSQIPERSKDHWERLEIQGVLLHIDDSGKTISIDTIQKKIDNPQEGEDNERNSHSA